MKPKTIPKLPMTAAIAAAIRRIPRGQVSTYGAVAEAAGYPRCARHVSKVLNQVPGLPWQRVLGSGGRISLPASMVSSSDFCWSPKEYDSRAGAWTWRSANITSREHDARPHPGGDEPWSLQSSIEVGNKPLPNVDRNVLKLKWGCTSVCSCSIHIIGFAESRSRCCS